MIPFTDLIILMVLALLIFGPRRLPEIGRMVGKGLAEFRKASNDLRRSINAELALEEDDAAARTRSAEFNRPTLITPVPPPPPPAPASSPQAPPPAPSSFDPPALPADPPDLPDPPALPADPLDLPDPPALSADPPVLSTDPPVFAPPPPAPPPLRLHGEGGGEAPAASELADLHAPVEPK